MRIVLCLAAIVLALPAARAADLYRWVDKNNKVHYGDIPETDDAAQLKVSPAGAAPASGASEASVSYEARRASKNFPVTLYVSEKCGDVCSQARDFLRKRKVPFSETMMKTPEEFEAFKQKTGFDNVPALSVGRTLLKGLQVSQWENELDAAGYPR